MSQTPETVSQSASANTVTTVASRNDQTTTTRTDYRRVLISSGALSAAHDAADGSAVGTPTMDGGTKTCSIVLGDTTHFAINSSTGAITVLSNVGLTAGVYTLRVKVVMADGSDEANIVVTAT